MASIRVRLGSCVSPGSFLSCLSPEAPAARRECDSSVRSSRRRRCGGGRNAMQTNLAERIALVTGASSGLGSQFARVLAANGALVVLAARRVERLKELRAEIESQGGEASVVQMDVTDLDS